MITPQFSNSTAELRLAISAYVAANRLVPPLCMDELKHHAKRFMQNAHPNAPDDNLIRVLINNETWRDKVSEIPFERRILLLPMCLRNHDKCIADMDKFGLICMNCGNCLLGNIQEEAENLGYLVLIAEGATVVTALIRQGNIDSVIGVSCFSTLKRTFPDMVSKAIPAIAIPLAKDGCKDTEVDASWLREMIHLKSEAQNTYTANHAHIKKTVRSWFENANLRKILKFGKMRTEKIGFESLAGPGKRYRPFLAASVFSALRWKNPDKSETIRKIAVAVECFHKASLIHDDIEDNDDIRYGKPAFHAKYGVPEALNAGDFLIGVGYRLISESSDSAEKVVKMLKIASSAHTTLSLGQGEELRLTAKEDFPSKTELIDIFKNKTAPAFEVALNLGAVAAGADDNLRVVLSEFSKDLGIAYQINDDISDIHEKIEKNDVNALKSSILVVLSIEKGLIAPDNFKKDNSIQYRDIEIDDDIINKARDLKDCYRNKALARLVPITNTELKCLLYRVTDSILR